MGKRNLKVITVGGLIAGVLGLTLWVAAQSLTERPGDFNGDGQIDSEDLFDFAYYFGLDRDDPLYETEGYRADFDHNGRVDELDLFYFTSHWHKT